VSDGILDENELIEITRRVKTSFTVEEREKLKILTKHLKMIIKDLFSRQFLQLMGGSACKCNGNESKIRSFNIYKVSIQSDGYQLRCENYVWDNEIKDYNDKPTTVLYEFKDKNRPLH
jgi:hypothetical protein